MNKTNQNVSNLELMVYNKDVVGLKFSTLYDTKILIIPSIPILIKTVVSLLN